MTMDILMVTFRRDLEFAEYSMRSVKKFASGFEDKVVVVPVEDAHLFESIAEENGFRISCIVEERGKGFLHHMAVICEADRLCSGDAVLHLDADCLFLEPVTPEDYLVDGKPVLCFQPFEEFRHIANRYGWKRTVNDAIGIDPEHEFMCRHPSVHLRGVYSKTRELIETAHPGMSWFEYILSCRNAYPQTFAEFPTLGQVAWSFFRDRYHWARFPNHNDGSHPALTREKLKAFWSVGGVEMINDRHPDQTARQAMDEILAD